MKTMRRGQKGFTLVEMLIVLGLLALLAAIVMPNTVGYLRRGEQRAYNADKNILQTATDTFYADESNKSQGLRRYPIGEAAVGGSTGSDSFATASYISMAKLVGGNYIPSAPPSASSSNIVGGAGQYTWYVDARGRVQSTPTYSAGVYP